MNPVLGRSGSRFAPADDLVGPIRREPWLGAQVLSYPNRPATITGVAREPAFELEVLEEHAEAEPRGPALCCPGGASPPR